MCCGLWHAGAEGCSLEPRLVSCCPAQAGPAAGMASQPMSPLVSMDSPSLSALSADGDALLGERSAAGDSLPPALRRMPRTQSNLSAMSDCTTGSAAEPAEVCLHEGSACIQCPKLSCS